MEIALGTYKQFFTQNGKIMVSVYMGRLLKVKACKIATVWIICRIYYGFADAGRGALSCLLAPVPGCKKP